MNGGNFKVRYNVMNISSMEAFAKVKGRVNQDCKDVYFIRAVGMNATYVKDIEQMDLFLTKQSSLGTGRYYRASALPNLAKMRDQDYYLKSYDAWMGCGRKAVVTKITETKEGLGEILGQACNCALELFRKTAANASVSMEKNFVVKLLFWFDMLVKEFVGDWSLHDSIKLVFSNITKKQEYLFCYLLTQIGFDVLLLQQKADIDEELKKLGLSGETALGAFGDCEIPEYDAAKYSASTVTADQALGYNQAQNRIQNCAPPSQGADVTTSRKVVNVRRADRDARTREQLKRERTIVTPARASGMPSGVRNAGASTSGVSPVIRNAGFPIPQGERREMGFEELALLAASVVMIAIHDDKGDVMGTGSGIMVGQKGYILTNNHVASRGRFYSVRIEDDEEIYQTDEMIKYNQNLDLAVIRIGRSLDPLPVYQGGTKLARGQKVVAIGSPLGLFNSVSDGIISGFRKLDDVDMIQFTAPISHGSSGGALLNMYGEVIGISTAGFDDGQNINLAVGYEYINQFIRGFV